MAQIQHQVRTFPSRTAILANKWRYAANTALVTASFVFVGALTLGLFH